MGVSVWLHLAGRNGPPNRLALSSGRVSLAQTSMRGKTAALGLSPEQRTIALQVGIRLQPVREAFLSDHEPVLTGDLASMNKLIGVFGHLLNRKLRVRLADLATGA
jgi:hypothetical protein